MGVGDAPTWLGALATVVALVVAYVVAIRQLREQRRAAGVERTLSFHRDLTTGEIGLARDRLSEAMWRVGSQQRKNAQDDYKCWQPSWMELLGAKYVELSGSVVDLSVYPEDMEPDANETPLRDLYKILWCFERIGAAREAGLLDNPLAERILGNHAVWWDYLCARVPPESTRYRKNLERLADHYQRRDPVLAEWAAADFPPRGEPKPPNRAAG